MKLETKLNKNGGTFMKKRKKILSLLLVVAMMVNMLPISTFAEEIVEPILENEVEVEISTADIPTTFAAGDAVYVTQGGTGDGSFATPVGTLADAYTAVTTGGEIRVLSDLTVAATTAFDAAKTVTIQSYSNETTPKTESPWTITRAVLNAEMFTVKNAAGSVTMKNIIIDGASTEASKTMLHVLNGEAVLGEGVVLQNHNIVGQYLNIACATPDTANTSTSLTIDGAVIKDNTLDDGANKENPNGILGAGSGGKVIIKSGEISNNTLKNSAVVVAVGSSGDPSFTMSGGRIENNTLAAGVAAVYMRGTAQESAFNFSGTAYVYDNKTAAGEQRNVFLKNTIAIGNAYLNLTGALTGDAKIGVYAYTMPSSSTKLVDVAIGTGGYTAVADDAKYFFSDKTTGAGITFSGNKVVLDYDARAQVDTNMDKNGKANISIKPTTQGTLYAILDNTGAVVSPSVTGATNVEGTNWYTADISGSITFEGLDPANGPYQVVTSNDSSTAPNGNSSGNTTNTKVGDLVKFLYVAGEAGVGFATGDDTADGSRATPKKTIAGAYKEATTDATAENTNVVIVLTDLTMRATTFNAGKTIIITSEKEVQTIKRSVGGSLLTVSGANDNLTLKNIKFDGNKNTNIPKSGPLVLVTDGNVVLDSGTTLQNNNNTGENSGAEFGGGMFVTKNGTTTGTATMKEGVLITGNKATWGGGIHVNYQARFTMEGGKISENYAVKYADGSGNGGIGGGLSGYNPGTTVTISGGAIQDNTAETYGGGFGVGLKASINLSGTPVITKNNVGGVANNLYLDNKPSDAQTIAIQAPGMANGANVYVFVSNMPAAIGENVTIATGAIEGDAAYFHSDKASQAGIIFDSNKVVLSYDARAQVDAKVDKDGKGQLTVTTTAGTKYAIANETGTVPSDVIAYDKDGDIVEPIDGWYTTDEGPLTFKPLELAKKYEVHSKPQSATGTTITPGGGTTVEIPVVGENTYAKPDTPNTGKTVIVIDPADKKIKYAVLDENGNQVYPTAPGTWKTGNGDKIEVELPNLEYGKKYQVVGVPIGDDTAKPVDKNGNGANVVTPKNTLKEIASDEIKRLPDSSEGKDKIVLNPTKADQDYGVYNPNTGKTEWKTGTGSEVVFDNLEPNVDYQVITRNTDADDAILGNQPSMPSKGVTVPAATVKPGDIGTTVDAAGKTQITVSPSNANTKYAIVDEDGKVIAPLASGDKDGWQTGTGSGKDLIFGDLPAGSKYTVVTTPKDDAKDTDGTVSDGNEEDTLYPSKYKPVDGATDNIPVGPTVTIPTVTEDQLKGTIVPATTDPATNATATITVQPTDKDLIYAVVDASGNVIGGTDGWKTGTGAGGNALNFPGLTPGKDYKVVTMPKGTNPKPSTVDPDDGTKITTPLDPAVKRPVNVIRETILLDENKGKDKITVNNPGAGFEIAIIDPDTGKVIAPAGNWKPGNANGAALTFEPLDPNKNYEVVIRPTTPEDSIRIPTRPGVTTPKIGDIEVKGIVEDANGPVANATVKVTVATVDGGYKTIEVKTNATGEYTIKSDKVKLPGTYAIYVDGGAKGSEKLEVEFIKEQPQNIANIKVKPVNKNIVGGSVSKNGEPVVDADVIIRDKNTGKELDPQPDGVLTTTDGGGYVVQNLPDGIYIIEMSGTSPFTSGMTEVKVENGKIVPNKDGGYKDTNVSVNNGVFISGLVAPLAKGEKATVSITVPITDENGDIIGTKTVTAQAIGNEDNKGFYQIPGVVDGEYPISVTSPTATVTGEITVASGVVTTGKGSVSVSVGQANITVPTNKPETPTNVVTGIVMDKDGKPVKDATVTIFDKDGNKVTPTVPAIIISGEGGGWAVEGLDPAKGPYHASIDKDGKNIIAGPITIDANGKVTGKTNVELPTTNGKALIGNVTDSTGKPAANATVVVKDITGKVIATTKTSGNGEYFVGNVPSDATVSIVTITGETGSLTNLSGTLPNGNVTTAVPGNSKLNIIGPDGGVLPVIVGASTDTVAKITVTGIAPTADPAVKITDGKLDVSELADGTYKVVVEQNGMEVEKTIVVKDNNIVGDPTFKITKKDVTGIVKYEIGTVPTKATIEIPGWSKADVNTRDGSYTLTGVPDGTYSAKIIVTDGNVNTVINVTLEVKNGVATYENPIADNNGATIATPIAGNTLIVKPTTVINNVIKDINDATKAINDAKADSSKTVAAINAIENAINNIKSLTEEGRKQLNPDAAKDLSTALTGLLGNLNLTANAIGVKNNSKVIDELKNQSALLVNKDELQNAITKNVIVNLALNVEDVTKNLTNTVAKDKNIVDALATSKGAKETAYLEIKVEKTTTVTENGNSTAVVTSVTELSSPVSMTLSIPEDLQGFTYYGIVRVHGGVAERIPSTATASEITFASAYYSTYAILASNEPIFSDDVEVSKDPVKPVYPGEDEGFGGIIAPSNGVVIPKNQGGTVTINPTNPTKGEDIIITVNPDTGYILDKLTVKDANGKELVFTPMGDGKYKVTMPNPAVQITVNATFKKLVNDPNINGVGNILNVVDHIVYMKGYEKGNFAPANNITRAEVAQIFYNLLKNKDNNLGNKASFNDIASNAWYAKAVNTLANIGILEGVGNGNYAPNKAITRAEFVVIASRFAIAATGGNTFSDVATTHWGYNEITTASAYGWIEGYGNGTFKPENTITRSEAVKVVNTMLVRSADKAYIDGAKNITIFSDVQKTHWAFYEIIEASNVHDFTVKDNTEVWTVK